MLSKKLLQEMKWRGWCIFSHVNNVSFVSERERKRTSSRYATFNLSIYLKGHALDIRNEPPGPSPTADHRLLVSRPATSTWKKRRKKANGSVNNCVTTRVNNAYMQNKWVNAMRFRGGNNFYPSIDLNKKRRVVDWTNCRGVKATSTEWFKRIKSSPINGSVRNFYFFSH